MNGNIFIFHVSNAKIQDILYFTLSAFIMQLLTKFCICNPETESLFVLCMTFAKCCTAHVIFVMLNM